MASMQSGGGKWGLKLHNPFDTWNNQPGEQQGQQAPQACAVGSFGKRSVPSVHAERVARLLSRTLSAIDAQDSGANCSTGHSSSGEQSFGWTRGVGSGRGVALLTASVGMAGPGGGKPGIFCVSSSSSSGSTEQSQPLTQHTYEDSKTASSPASISVASPPSTLPLGARLIQPLQQGLRQSQPGQLLKAALEHGAGHLHVLTAGVGAAVARQLDKAKHWMDYHVAHGEKRAMKVEGMLPKLSQKSESEKFLEKGREREKACDPEGAMHVYKELAQLDPSYDNTIRLAKSLSDMVYLSSLSKEKAMIVSQEAIDLASKAIEMDPENVDGHVIRCISRGRLASFSDSRTKVQLAKHACDDAKLALHLGPDNDFAQHLMGRWHFEMAGINPFVRSLVGMIFGASLMPGTYEESLNHYKTAMNICPDKLIHKVGVGQALHKLGDIKGAVDHLQGALTMPVEDINSQFQLMDANVILKTIGKTKEGARLLAETKTVEPLQEAITQSQAKASDVTMVNDSLQLVHEPDLPMMATPDFRDLVNSMEFLPPYKSDEISDILMNLGPKMTEVQKLLQEHLDNFQSQWRISFDMNAPKAKAAALPLDRPSEVIRKMIEEGAAMESEFNPAAAASVFDELVQLSPSAKTYSRLAMNLSDMSYVPGLSKKELLQINAKAVEAATAAVKADPDCVDAHVALSASKAHLAHFANPRTKLQLVQASSDSARTALSLDANNDLANHWMGRLNYELAGVNPLVRLGIKAFLGVSLMPGSYVEAAKYYKVAATLSPTSLIHRAELGRALSRDGQLESAVTELKAAVAMTPRDIRALNAQETVEGMLKELEASGKHKANQTPLAEPQSISAK